MSINSQANQYTNDEREQVMWDIYIINLLKGIDNAMQAAIEAGYAIDTARNITLTGWYKERKDRLRRKDMLSKAERNLDKVLDFDMMTKEGKVNTPVATLVTTVSTTIVKSLGKDEYSERKEVTGANGEKLFGTEAEKAIVDGALDNI